MTLRVFGRAAIPDGLTDASLHCAARMYCLSVWPVDFEMQTLYSLARMPIPVDAAVSSDAATCERETVHYSTRAVNKTACKPSNDGRRNVRDLFGERPTNRFT